MTRPPRDAPDAAPRWARPFVLAFLALFVACAVAGIEAWPLTGWRLFSRLRTDRQVGWQAVVVDAAGRERPFPFEDLPLAYRGHVQVLQGFPRLLRREQAAVCAAWAEAAAARRLPVAALRIYRTEALLSRRAGPRAEPPVRSLRYECRGARVDEVPAPQEPARARG